MPTFPTDPWFQDLIAQINASADYLEAAATWEGDISFLVEAEPDKGIARGRLGPPRPVARDLPRRWGGRGAARPGVRVRDRAPPTPVGRRSCWVISTRSAR